jgi:ribosomal protein S18 acetylase RimI-like enzyme
MTSPAADVSVRVGWADDALAIAEVQVAAWRQEYAGLLPDDLVASLDVGQFAAAWQEGLTRPADARNRVLVALERQSVRGFAVTGPSTDPDSDAVADGEIGELVVDPAHTRAGHGSRLLQACVDTMQADRFVRATIWVNTADDVRRGFLASAGWEPDGAHRELDLRGDGAVRVKQVRLHADIRTGQ